jgi:FOG: WD40-like repeat
VHAIDTQTGTERWRYTGLTGFEPPLMFADGTLLVDDGGAVYGLRATAGEVDWQFSRQDSEILGVRVGGGRVFVSVTDSEQATVTHALDSGTGAERWETAGDVRAYADTTLYGADQNGDIQAVDAETGDRRWRSPESAEGVIAVTDTTVYSVQPDNLPIRTRGTSDTPEDRATAHAIDTTTGTVTWERGDVSGYMRPTVVDDTLVLSTAGQLSPLLHDPEIIGLDTATGERTWGWPVPREASTRSPIVVDGRMYVVNGDALYAVKTDTDGSSRDAATLHGVNGHHGGWVYGGG